MNEQLHILITRDRGKIVQFPCTIKKLRLAFSISAVVLLFLVVTSLFSVSIFTRNHAISSNISELRQELKLREEIIVRHEKENEAQRLKLSLQVANLERNNEKQAANFKKEQALLISTAVSKLNERSELIEKIMDSVGINLDKKETTTIKHSGGPFIPQADEDFDELLLKADNYLKKIRCIPLGRPVQGAITSRFGKRKDPVNNKIGFHTGIDFRGKVGDKIYATADGVVKKAFRNGGYGNYVLLSHGNGFTTSFAHMQTFIVKKGDRIKRGQLIGLVGNTGRSTGSHLHYEVCLDKKPINPYKFMKIANLLGSNSDKERESNNLNIN
jgi:murein DD-endopeptidase MepM/ murein hydrolase activator NlpD